MAPEARLARERAVHAATTTSSPTPSGSAAGLPAARLRTRLAPDAAAGRARLLAARAARHDVDDGDDLEELRQAASSTTASSYGTKEMEFAAVEALPTRVPAPAGGRGRRRRSTRRAVAVAGLVASIEAASISRDARGLPRRTSSDRAASSASRRTSTSPRNCGWFSCRSVCYLAAGRPVVVQDTGFTEVLPTGDGLLAVPDLDDAVAGRGVGRARLRAPLGRRAAVAAEHFAADKVLGQLVDEIGLRLMGLVDEITGGWDYSTLPANVCVGPGAGSNGGRASSGSAARRSPGSSSATGVKAYTWTEFNVEPTGILEVGDDTVLVGAGLHVRRANRDRPRRSSSPTTSRSPTATSTRSTPRSGGATPSPTSPIGRPIAPAGDRGAAGGDRRRRLDRHRRHHPQGRDRRRPAPGSAPARSSPATCRRARPSAATRRPSSPRR